MKESYKCEYCGKEVKIEDDKNPTCCGKPMKKQQTDVCLQPAHAEHARSMESDEPCDDGRAG
jgi:hypothetical protein